jgi:hypothetical protein
MSQRPSQRAIAAILFPKRERDVMLEVLKELKLRRENHEADFWTTARKLAAGEKVATTTIERVLAESSKTPAELEAAVALATQRTRWHEARQAAAAVEKEEPAIQDRIAAERRKLQAAEKAHEEATAPLYAKLDHIRAAMSAASDARRQLIQTCPDAALKTELAAVSDRLAELRTQEMTLKERGELIKQAERDEETADRLVVGLVPFASTARIDRLREQAARKRELGQQALAALADVQRDIAKAEKEQEAVYERMTAP